MTPQEPALPGSPDPGAVRAVSARLRDGRPVLLRPVEPEDRPQVVEFLSRVSRDSLERRFFAATTPDAVAAMIVAPHRPTEGISMIVEVPDPAPGAIVAHGEYDRGASDPTRAEVAFLVADAWQGQGAATLLLLRLAELASAAGVQQLEAVVLADNQPMIDVFLGAGFPCSITWHDGEGLVLLEIGHEPAPRGPPHGSSRDSPLVSA